MRTSITIILVLLLLATSDLVAETHSINAEGFNEGSQDMKLPDFWRGRVEDIQETVEKVSEGKVMRERRKEDCQCWVTRLKTR